MTVAWLKDCPEHHRRESQGKVHWPDFDGAFQSAVKDRVNGPVTVRDGLTAIGMDLFSEYWTGCNTELKQRGSINLHWHEVAIQGGMSG